MSIMPPGSESNNDAPSADDLRSAADVLEQEWRGGWYDARLGFNDDGVGVPAADHIAEMRAEADRLDGDGR